MKIIARDTLGNSFEKTIELSNEFRGTVVSLGFPVQWYLHDLQSSAPEHGGRCYIDSAGRSHRGFPVFVDHAELMEKVSILRARGISQ